MIGRHLDPAILLAPILLAAGLLTGILATPADAASRFLVREAHGSGHPPGRIPPEHAPALAFTPVVILQGDSQCTGTTSTADQTAAVAAYPPDARIRVLNAAGTWSTYAPGSRTGLSFGADNGAAGAETGLIARFRARYPDDPLYVIKDCSAGSFQSRGPATGTLTGSISGNLLTLTAGSAAPNSLLVGNGVGKGTYALFPQGGNSYYVGSIGQTSYVGGPTGSTGMTRYDCTRSWSSDEGCVYNGYAGGITSGMRHRAVTAIAGMVAAGLSPRIVGVLHMLGTNDMAAAETAAPFGSELAAFLARERSDLPLADARIVLMRVGAGAAGSATVRAAQMASAQGDPAITLVDTDGLTRWDNTHLDLAGLTTVGRDSYAIMFEGAPGMEP